MEKLVDNIKQTQKFFMFSIFKVKPYEQILTLD